MLTDLAIKYGTDKLEHNYIQFYEHRLQKIQPKRLLEIGVKEGASISMWKEFLPNTEIHGLDLFIEHPIPTIEGVTFHKGSQIDTQLLEQLRKLEFDVIIDDGSHNSRDQLITFFGLYHPNCHYFIEDMHCADEDFYLQGLPREMAADWSIPASYAWRDCQSPILYIHYYQ